MILQFLKELQKPFVFPFCTKLKFPAPVNNNLFFNRSFISVFVFCISLHDTGLIFEIITDRNIIFIPISPFLFFPCAFQQAFRNDVPIPGIQYVHKILIITDPAVCNHDKAGKIQSVDVLFSSRAECEMVKRVSGEGFDGNGDTGIIHKKPHLDDRKFSLFLAYTDFTLAFFQEISSSSKVSSSGSPISK